jgi:hypothetical protein
MIESCRSACFVFDGAYVFGFYSLNDLFYDWCYACLYPLADINFSADLFGLGGCINGLWPEPGLTSVTMDDEAVDG